MWGNYKETIISTAVCTCAHVYVYGKAYSFYKVNKNSHCTCAVRVLLCAQSGDIPYVKHFRWHTWHLSHTCRGSLQHLYSSSSMVLQLWYSLGLLNNILPFKTILDLSCPFHRFHLFQVIPNIIFSS